MSKRKTKGRAGGPATATGVQFQKRLGVYFGALLLSERSLDRRLGLGNPSVASVAMETNAPVDDILVGTSDGGYIAVQAKTGLSLSAKPKSRFHETIRQMVNHWLDCNGGNGDRGWDRPLDTTIDRLVIAVDPATPLTVREHLPIALRHLRDPSTISLAQPVRRALRDFQTCVEDAWREREQEPPDEGLLAELADLVVVFVFDSSDTDRVELLLEQPAAATSSPSELRTALDETFGDLMENGGQMDATALRTQVMAHGVNLKPPRHLAGDVKSLLRHSASIAEQLGRYERIELDAVESVNVVRDCQSAISEAAQDGSLLIIGEAGIGKSAVLSALARHLRDEGQDVVQLAVDRHSVETLEGLGRELQVEHDLVKVLQEWDGPGQGWLLLDGLDAARGGITEGVFRTLIRRTIELRSRWHVVASIRSFDLQMGQEYRELFRGAPPVAGYSDDRFDDVRHVSVPPWSDTEFEGLLGRFAALRSALAYAPADLVDLARVPFNTNLIAELVDDGVEAVALEQVSSQAQLLDLHWDRRVRPYGTAGQVCVFGAVETMLDERALRAPKHKVESPSMLDQLSSDGVLIEVSGDLWVQFRHHVLFDFAAAQRLRASSFINQPQPELNVDNANGLLLAPAMRFVLQKVWEDDKTREQFWAVTERLVADDDVDPVIRVATARMAADLPRCSEDIAALVRRVGSGGTTAASALSRISGAVVIAMEDGQQSVVTPWVSSLSDLAAHVACVPDVLRVLLFSFVDRVIDEALRTHIGTAARALLEYAFDEDGTSFHARAAIGFVAKTHGTNRNASRQLLRRVYETSRFDRFGFQEVPALCAETKAIMGTDPAFVAEIYASTYTHEVTDDRKTSMTSSQILPLTSTARQDYEMARYHLNELFSEFLVAFPQHAVAGAVAVVGRYAARQSLTSKARSYDMVVAGRLVQLQEDGSSLWAYDPEDSHGDGPEKLVVELLKTLRTCAEDSARRIVEGLVAAATHAVFWSRMFAAAAYRDDSLLDLMLPYALEAPFLVAFDTRKDAIDAIAKGYDRLLPKEQVEFEQLALSQDFSEYGEQAQDLRQDFCETLFGAIGCGRLATPEARQFLVRDDGTPVEERPNERPMRITTGWIGPEGSDKHETYSSPALANAAKAIRAAEKAFGENANSDQRFSGSFDDGCMLMEAVNAAVTDGHVGPELRLEGEEIIGRGCLALCLAQLLPSAGDATGTERYLRLLRVASSSEGPEVAENTEASFERMPSWGSPAPRVDAAQAMMRTVGLRPDLLWELSADLDEVLTDPHPAVRMRACQCLGQVRHASNDEFQTRLTACVRHERNKQVLTFLSQSVLRDAIGADPAAAEPLVIDLLKHQLGNDEAQLSFRQSLATNLAILAIRHEREAASAVIESWILNCAVFSAELGKMLVDMRSAYTLGLRGDNLEDHEWLRHRAQDLALRIAEAASTDFLSRAAQVELSEADADLARRSARLLDTACDQLDFSLNPGQGGDGPSDLPLEGLAVLLTETFPIMMCIAGAGTPHTVYRLLELVQRFLPVDPGKVADIAMHAVLGGGKQSGFQFESMGAHKLVELFSRLLADHRQVFEDEERRRLLVKCLDLFVGWPPAARLLHRLPEVFR